MSWFLLHPLFGIEDGAATHQKVEQWALDSDTSTQPDGASALIVIGWQSMFDDQMQGERAVDVPVIIQRVDRARADYRSAGQSANALGPMEGPPE